MHSKNSSLPHADNGRKLNVKSFVSLASVSTSPQDSSYCKGSCSLISTLKFDNLSKTKQHSEDLSTSIALLLHPPRFVCVYSPCISQHMDAECRKCRNTVNNTTYRLHGMVRLCTGVCTCSPLFLNGFLHANDITVLSTI